MAGNVSEWVSDWYDPGYYGTPAASGVDPVGPSVGSQKVIRGGSWDSKPFFARSVHRQSLAPDSSTNATGFRCATNAPAIIPTLTSEFTATITPTLTATPSSQGNLVVSPTALALTNTQLPNLQPTMTATASG